MASTQPSTKASAFDCPYCKAYSRQTWLSVSGSPLVPGSLPQLIDHTSVDPGVAKALQAMGAAWGEAGTVVQLKQPLAASVILPNAHFSKCDHCRKAAIWFGEMLAYPPNSTAPPPHPEMPGGVKKDYLEARDIVGASPRGAAALLRLALQKLCAEAVGQENINAATEILVGKGLDTTLVRALDVLRVVGNNAVHPGQMNLDEDRATANQLFELTNLCVDGLISRPKRIAEMFERLPEGSRKAIAARDEKAARAISIDEP